MFKSLRDDERHGKTGLRRKNPRICPYERLRQNIDNCCYAGEKGHGPLCWKYAAFVKKRKEGSKGRFNDKRFFEDANRFIGFCRENNVRRPESAFQSPNLPRNLFKDCDDRERADLFRSFQANWSAYLREMNLTGETVLTKARLPHCAKIGERFEKSKCEHNPHTELCLEYRRALAAAREAGSLSDADLDLEPLYREWRKSYLAPPKKPEFHYPSSRDLPMPKIFGERFFEIDFDRSVLRLRLDDMRDGEWIEFGFKPWPRRYRPSKRDVNVTSIHVNFIGVRPRAGFRFDAEHSTSRFACTQDEIDELRSRRFPRQAQDRQFLDAARKRLLDSFSGEARKALRLLAVDLGEKGACAAVYQGTTFEKSVPLKIVKIDKLYESPPAPPAPQPGSTTAKPTEDQSPSEDFRGLKKEHVGRHLSRIAEHAAEIAEHRRSPDTPNPVPRAHDDRSLKRHIAWMIRDWARLNASQIIDAAEEHECDLIVFESMRGFKPPGYDQLGEEAVRQKRSAAMFAYGRVRRKVAEKAVERGMRVVTVPYFKSSQVCSACGHEQMNKGLWSKNKKERKFRCQCGDERARKKGERAPHPGCRCRAELGSDENAARVLARVFWGEITLPEQEERGSSSKARRA